MIKLKHEDYVINFFYYSLILVYMFRIELLDQLQVNISFNLKLSD